MAMEQLIKTLEQWQETQYSMCTNSQRTNMEKAYHRGCYDAYSAVISVIVTMQQGDVK